MNVKSITCKNVADGIESGLSATDIIAEVARRIKKKGGRMSKSHRRIIAAVRDIVDRVDDTVLETVASDSDAMSGHDIHVRTLEDATYDDLASRQADLDRTLWGRCLAKCEEVHDTGARWAAYSLMDEMGIPRPRIAAAAGCKNVNSVTQGISKYRRGIKPDLSFVGK